MSLVLSGSVAATGILFLLVVLLEAVLCDVLVNLGGRGFRMRVSLMASALGNSLSVSLGGLMFAWDPLHMWSMLSVTEFWSISFIFTVIIEWLVYCKFFQGKKFTGKRVMRVTVVMNLASYLILAALMPPGYLW